VTTSDTVILLIRTAKFVRCRHEEQIRAGAASLVTSMNTLNENDT
jgi:hypothetical protein